jgi:hypothetical protein
MKNMSYLHRGTIPSIAAILAIFLGIMLLPCGDVSGKNTVTAPTGDQKIVIQSVNSTDQSITITDGDKKTTTYTIDDFTQITVLGQTGKFSDLKAGQEVLSFVERSSSALDNLVVGETTSLPTATAKAKKPKLVKATVN